MSSPYTRLIDQPKKQPPKFVLMLSYIATGIIWIIFGIFIVKRVPTRYFGGSQFFVNSGSLRSRLMGHVFSLSLSILGR